ncbi:polyphosphate kinase 2 family protein [Undibacterium sp.]|jgi:PPK2 family polyphosphate:nucleotide phosphotransferase|uniref:polyphosphate kinase 2 family protein n=1 Tax=Undibacterium sp. TaxID=1914977 RepID=UPI002BA34892|nr:polyphosphate kinase 2 family protein [Undibacterium sp.]HTD03128.1 polyphosphate kinase 2 family protein [Undibacterium sp.]
MPVSSLFRPGGKFKIKDADAGKRPLDDGEKKWDKDEAKTRDKLAVMKLGQQISDYQEILYAQKKYKLLVILQGMDTSGKDGTVRGVFGQVNPLGARTVAFKTPSSVEKEHDYLWRVHQEVPVNGEIVIFNRSHYEDVLITRVHDWIDDDECARRYAQIRDFERMLTETGTVILKFFLHISKQQQKQRLEERIADPHKHWKFDPQDLAERVYWDAYQAQYERVISATDAPHAPWHIIPADSKTQRNLAIASIVVEKLEGLELEYPPAKPELAKLKIA